MNNFTFLTDEQRFGNNQLDIISRYGTKCAITDFSILLGGYVSSDYYTSEGNTRKDRTGWWWTKSSDGDNDALVVSRLVMDIGAVLIDAMVGLAQLYLTLQSNQSPRTE